jgi:hypothetical protein
MMDIGLHDQIQDCPSRYPKRRPPGVPRRDIYLVRAYEYPEEWEDCPQKNATTRLLDTRLILRAMGEESGDMIVFSFWPDVIMLKEIGDP